MAINKIFPQSYLLKLFINNKNPCNVVKQISTTKYLPEPSSLLTTSRLRSSFTAGVSEQLFYLKAIANYKDTNSKSHYYKLNGLCTIPRFYTRYNLFELPTLTQKFQHLFCIVTQV